MKKSNNTIIIVSVVLTVAALCLLAYYLISPDINWNQHYKPEEKNPYGTHVIKYLLENNDQKRDFEFVKDSVYKSIHTDPTKKTDAFVFIGSAFYGNERDLDSILQFVEKGNVALFMTEYFPSEYMFRLLKDRLDVEVTTEDTTADPEYYDDEYSTYDTYEEPYYDHEDVEAEEYDEYSYWKSMDYFTWETEERIKSSLKGSRAKADHFLVYDFDTIPGSWLQLSEDARNQFQREAIEDLGFYQSSENSLYRKRTNFFRIKHGEGYVYIHLNPLAFTNYHLLQEEGMRYAREVFRYSGDGKIYWDEDNRQMDFSDFRSRNEKPGMPDENALEFILSEPALRKAWYILLFAGILFLCFGARRKQRVIPILEKKDNTSIEYAEVISQLFLEQTDHRKLVELKTELFRAYIRERFNVKITNETDIQDSNLIALLASRANVGKPMVSAILNEEVLLRSHTFIDTSMMLNYHRKLEEFYFLSK